MIKFTDVSYGFPQKDLYNKICFEIEEKDHAVLIGSNGTGKSTLIDMIIHTEDYLYDGKIEKDDKVRIGLVSQFVKHDMDEMTSFEYLAMPFIELQKKADAVCEKMQTAENMEAAYEEYQACLDEIEAVDGYNYEVNIKKELAVAGVSHLENNSIHQISGGEFKLLSIIRNMLLKPQLLIMDEPDVFLDFENLIGLARLINHYEGTLLAITHNRLLLSQCFQKVLHLENEELQEFPGTFAEYNQAMLETKIEMQEQATKDAQLIEVQKKYVEKLRADATRIASPVKGRQLKARATYLARLQARQCKNPFIEDRDFELQFPDVETGVSISVKNYSLVYEKELLSNVSFDIMPGAKVAIVGANGTGKSSLLRDIYHMLSQDEEKKDKVALFTQIYEQDETQKLSGGERNIAKLKEIADSNASILLLDEPTSHLDTYAQIALENAIRDYKGTVLMVSHDFYTIANCADQILSLEDGTVRETSARAYRKSIYKKYFDSDIFEQERVRREKEIKINALLKEGKYAQAREVLS